MTLGVLLAFLTACASTVSQSTSRQAEQELADCLFDNATPEIKQQYVALVDRMDQQADYKRSAVNIVAADIFKVGVQHCGMSTAVDEKSLRSNAVRVFSKRMMKAAQGGQF